MNQNDQPATQADAPGRDTSRHTLTTKQASLLFSELGVPRSPRSVQRFCEAGHLDCIRVQGENAERYFVNRESVLRYAKELKQIEAISRIDQEAESVTARHDATERDTSRHDAPRPAMSEVAPSQSPASTADTEIVTLREKVEVLEKEKFQLAIDRAAKEQVISQMVDERRAWMAELMEISRQKGQLEVRVEQLAAPQRDMPRQESDSDVTRIAEASATEVIHTTEQERPATTEPERIVAAEDDQEAQRPTFFQRLFR